MVLIHATKQWKPVEYLPNNADENFHFLASFEELREYSLSDDEKQDGRLSGKRTSRGTVVTKQPKRKLKATEKVKQIRAQKRRVDDGESAKKREKMTANGSVSLKAWAGLGVPEPILRCLAELNFAEPTPIQRACLPAVIGGRRDVLGAAETGSGKTLAFGIPIVSGLLGREQPADTPGALILAPTRELAMQVKAHLDAIIKYTDITIVSVVGGLSVQKQERLLRSKPDILIATPGRLWALIKEDDSYAKGVKNVRYLAIDEIDRMVEKGHFEELNSILEFLHSSETKRQTLVFSATLTFVHPLPKRLLAKRVKPMKTAEKIENLAGLLGLRSGYELVDLTQKFGMSSSLTESCLYCSDGERKDTYLYYFLNKYPGRTLIFVNSIDCARRLRSLLATLKVDVHCLHAGLNQKKRLVGLERFERNANGILVATDVAARGLDVKNVEHVVHYHVPRTAELYVHRSGRTARQQKPGFSLLLIGKQDVQSFWRIRKTIRSGKDVKVFPVEEKYLEECAQRVRVATELEAIQHRMKGEKDKKNWFKNTAKEADLPWDDGDVDDENRVEVEQHCNDRIAELRSMLAELFAERSARQLISKYPLFAKQVDSDSDDELVIGQNAIDAQASFRSGRKPKFAFKLKKRQKHQGGKSLKRKKQQQQQQKKKKNKKSGRRR